MQRERPTEGLAQRLILPSSVCIHSGASVHRFRCPSCLTSQSGSNRRKCRNIRLSYCSAYPQFSSRICRAWQILPLVNTRKQTRSHPSCSQDCFNQSRRASRPSNVQFPPRSFARRIHISQLPQQQQSVHCLHAAIQSSPAQHGYQRLER